MPEIDEDGLYIIDDYEDPKPIPCPDCHGNPGEDECITCGGDGWIEE
jgi:hypothetical protein